jgi:hypothetical protein
LLQDEAIQHQKQAGSLLRCASQLLAPHQNASTRSRLIANPQPSLRWQVSSVSAAGSDISRVRELDDDIGQRSLGRPAFREWKQVLRRSTSGLPRRTLILPAEKSARAVRIVKVA